MKSLLLLNCFLFFIGCSLADNDGGCQIEGIDNNDFITAYSITIDDTQVNTNVLETPYTGTLVVEKYSENSNASYFVVAAENNNFVIKTTEDFGDFDKNTPKQVATNFLVTVDCTLTCANGDSPLTIRIFINDINTHPPTFQLEKYEFKVPSPIMPRTDFSLYGDAAIIATDIDFSNQNVVFTIEPDDFGVSGSSSTDSKDYKAVFAASRIIQLTENRTYTVTATDTGTSPGPLSSTTTITLVLDEANSLETPTFEKSSYGFTYTIEGNTLGLTELDGDITITTRKATSLVYEISGEYSGYFGISFDTTTEVFTLSPKQLLPVDVDSFVIVTLTATSDNTAVTSLVVYLPTATDETPHFSNPYYTGSYNDVSNTVELDSAIEVTSLRTPTVNISGEYAEHFTVKYDEKAKSIQIDVKTKLSLTEIKSKSFATLEVMASVADSSDTATIVLSLPQHKLQFTQGLYTATYASDSLTDSPTIGFTTDSSGVKIQLGGTYKEYFDIKSDLTNKQWTFALIKPLSSEILTSEHDIVISLTATDDYEDTAESVVSIELPNAISDSPQFSEANYLAEYADDGWATVFINKNITITNRDDQSKIKITLDSYTDYFQISYDDTKNVWAFTSLSPLPEDILLTEKELIITLIAEEDGNSNKGEATVVVNWVLTEALKFSQVYYVGEYPESGTGTIKITPNITFTNALDQQEIDITLDNYADNFKVLYNTVDGWYVEITKSLDDTVIDQNTELVIILSAAEFEIDGIGESVLVLNLPSTTAPKFSEAIYVGEYPESGTGTIELETDIQLTNVDPTNVAISLDKYASNFKIEYNSNKWTLTIQSPLDKNVLYSNAELTATLIATEIGNKYEGTAALVLNLPTSIIGTAPKFSDAFYVVEYPETGSGVIEFANPIEFLNVNDLTSITITLDKYTDNFEISYNNDAWQINVIKALDAKILEENAELVVSLIATETDNEEEGLSALILKLPSAAVGTAPKFSEPYYVAEYPENGTGTIEFEGPIEFVNVADLTKLTLSLDQYAENFEISYEANKWQLNVKKSLSQTVLYHNTELVMSLVAKEEGNQNAGYAALVLKLPSATKAIAPIFSEAYYTAEYPESGDGTIEFDTAVSFTNVEDPTKLKINVEQFESNFEITYEEDTWHIHIIQSLSDTILHNNVELVMTLVATEDGVEGQGSSAVILKLPSSVTGTAPKFLDAYYLADYPDNGTATIEFETPIQFVNIDEPSEVTITLDKYADNFEVVYHSDRWYINVKKGLEETVLHGNVELVMTMIATSSETKEVGDSALVLKLPTAEVGTAPIFSDAYYLVKYPKANNGTIELENPITFKNVDDITKINIATDSYTENFDVVYNSNSWYIQITKGLEEATLKKNVELVITLIATETGNDEEGRSALVLEMPSYDDTTTIEFSEAYYLAQYPVNGSDVIDFETPLKFKNVDDPSSVEITLSQYSSNFEVAYDGKEWHINIIKQLDESVLLENSELVMTLTAENEDDDTKGYSVLVLNLPSTAEAPHFSNAYYQAEYPENGTGNIEFKSPVTFTNVDNPIDVQIKLDNYLDNFEIVYSSDRWYIKITEGLEESVLSKNVELIMTMIATETGHEAEGEATLVLKLPRGSVAPEFSDAYYLAEYVENESGVIEFQTPITFLNVEDATTIKISLDNYVDNFEVKYSSTGWYLKLNSNLQKTILNENVELVMTLTAVETGNTNEGYAALVIKLPAAAKATAPEFEMAYYIAKYPENGEKSIEFDNAIKFLNVDDPESVSITVDTYSDNFDIIYESNKWSINIKQNLDGETLAKNVELVMVLIATETENENQGYSALVLKLPTASFATGITFSKTYYTADYPETGNGTVDINDAIEFYNVDDINTVTIGVDTYQENFQITYESNKWVLNVIKNLDSDVFVKNTELVMTLIATNSADNTEDHSALVVILPMETGPIFSDAYYTAEYPKDVNDIIELENDITFKNVEDAENVNIILDKYTEYFDITLVLNKWYIQIKEPLDESILNENTELVATLVATETNKQVEGYSALVIKLPVTSATGAPEFSKPYYEASYESDGDQSSIVLADAITIINKDDLSKITITVDNYDEYFSVVYDDNQKVWKVNVLKSIPDDILDSKTDLVFSLTATDTTNNLSGYSVIDLTLSSIDIKTPKFSQAYYTGKYEFSDNTPIVTLDTPLEITNKDNLKDVSITLDNYADNFKIEYLTESNEWKVEVTTNLDEPTLNAKTELLITLTATDSISKKTGQCVLALTLPEVNSDEAPKFSSIYYSGQYKTSDGGSINIDDSIEIINKDDLTKVTINFDDTYKNNFEINFDAASSKWVLTVKAPLDDSVLEKSVELILTLTAIEVDNPDIGQAVIILDLPLDQAELPPKFSLPHYAATYSVQDDKASISLDDSITVVNKERLTDISVALDSYQTNFIINYDSSKQQWTLDVGESLSDDILESQRELVLTLTATENGNDNTGESTLIVTLPSSDSTDEVVKFSQVHYAAEYVTGNDDQVEVDDTIKVESKVDTKDLVISFENEEYADHFQIVLESDIYVVKVLTPLPSTILGTQVSLPLTLVATLDESKSYATLVINLPPATTDHSIRFSKPLYDATYSVSEAGTVTFQVQGSIEVNTDAEDADVEAGITSTTGYEQYFGFSYANNVLSVVKTQNIPDSVLRIKSFIPLILTVGLKGTTDAVSSVLNVAIDFSGNEEVSLISFSNVLYQGKYEVTDGTGVLTVNDIISVKTDESDSNVEVMVANEYFGYFRAVYSNKVVTLELLQQIPGEILNITGVIPIILEAAIKGSDNPALTVVNIEVIYNSEEDPGLIQFSTVLYTAHYAVDNGKGQLSVDQDIKVITDADDSQVKPSIEDSDYAKYFSVTYGSKTVSVKLESDIPDSVLKGTSTIPVVLTAEITGTTHRHSAVLNVIFNEDEDTKSVEFSKPLYNGEYDVSDGKVTLTVDDIIEITTDENDDNIDVIVSNEYDAYFAVSYSNKIVTITPTQEFSTDFLNKSSVIPIVLQAGIKGSGYKVSAVLNLAIIFDFHEDTALLEFATFLYTGKLTVTDGKEELTLDQDIEVLTDAKDTEISASLFKHDNDLSEYFSATYSEKIVLVKLVKDIPEDVLAVTPSISLSLLVSIIGSTQKSQAVLNIPVYNSLEEKSVKFSDSLYNGKYMVTDGIGILTIEDDIEVITNEGDDSNIEVVVSNEFDGYIETSYSKKVVTISLKKQLSTEILTGVTFISVKLQASVKNSIEEASAVLNIAITYEQEDPILIEFSTLRYTGQYSVVDGKGELEIEDIKVITDADDSKIKPNIFDVADSDYSKYFMAIYDGKSITIQLTTDIPEDVLKVTRLIPLVITAEIIGSTYRSSAILDIIINNADTETKSVDFSEIIYHGKYKVTDGNGVLTVDDKIQIDTSEDDNKINVIVSNEYDGYFLASYSNKIVTVTLKKQLSEEILNTTVVPVALKASITGTPYEDFAVLNIIIFYDGEPDPNSVLEFSSILYYGNYSVIDDKGKLLLNDGIKIITDKSDDDIEVGLSEDSLYKNLFTISYSDHIVSITLNKNLPEDLVTNNALIALTLVADIKGTTQRSSAVLNIEFDPTENDNDSKSCGLNGVETAYIAVITILAILLIALTAGAVAFYFLRIRKRNYSNLEEEDGRVRFNKHSLKRSSSDIKPSSSLEERRPTGFIFNPISEDSADGTDSIGEPEKTRRKSVAFDDNVEKLQLEPSIEEDNVSEDDNNTNNPEITRV